MKKDMENIPDYSSGPDDDKKPSNTLGGESKPGYISTNLAGWKDIMLKPALIRALKQSGFQHPSQVQQQCIPYAVEGHDILCQAKSGMGKTAVFVLSILNQVNKSHQLIIAKQDNANQLEKQNPDSQIGKCIVVCHTRQLAYQIQKDFKRFGKFAENIKCSVFYGGVLVEYDKEEIKKVKPQIIVVTPGRLYSLMEHKFIDFSNVTLNHQCKYFIIDECDKVLGNPKMRADVQSAFIKTPKNKQVLMFSATLPEEIKKDCKFFMQDPMQVFIDESKLVLHGLSQYYVLLPEVIIFDENKKYEKLTHLLDNLSFNQTIIFVNKVDRARKLKQLLQNHNFNPICIHSKLKQEERIQNYDKFKNNQTKLMVATDLFGRGMDIERVDFVINYDFPENRDTYLHRVGRAGRFGTKGLAINFVRSDMQEDSMEDGKLIKSDKNILKQVQQGFKIKIHQLPKQLDTSSLMGKK